MTALTFAIPGDIETPTGGYAYARGIIPCLRDEGLKVQHMTLPAGFPEPSDEELALTQQLLQNATGVLMIDGLAFGAMPESVIASIRAPIVGLVHHPLALETGLDEAEQKRLFHSERQALAHAARIVVTSRTTAATLIAEYDVREGAITVAEPGTERALRATRGGETPHLIAVGSLAPRKGYDVLIEALSRLRDMPWRCTIAGAKDREPRTTAEIIAALDKYDLTGRVHLAGALSERQLDALYADADMFVLASYYEGYGMAFAAAMARGLPIVATWGGATAQTVPREAGILVAPGDVAAFAAAVRSLLTDFALLERYADAAWAHAQTLPTWGETARRIASVIREVAG